MACSQQHVLPNRLPGGGAPHPRQPGAGPRQRRPCTEALPSPLDAQARRRVCFAVTGADFPLDTLSGFCSRLGGTLKNLTSLRNRPPCEVVSLVLMVLT